MLEAGEHGRSAYLRQPRSRYAAPVHTPSRPGFRNRIAHARLLWKLWRAEQQDPEPFRLQIAGDVADTLAARYGPLQGQRIADLGSGPGTYTLALRALGADAVPIDSDEEELRMLGEPPEGFVVADAGNLPFEDGSFDGVLCSNLLEHAPDTEAILREITRILKPGGWAYISWTNWYSPWGGHDMSPYQYLGPNYGPRLYEHRHGYPRKNTYGEGLFPVHIGPTIKLVESDPGIEVEGIEPRYWPGLRAIIKVPIVREVLTWNCVIYCRRTG